MGQLAMSACDIYDDIYDDYFLNSLTLVLVLFASIGYEIITLFVVYSRDDLFLVKIIITKILISHFLMTYYTLRSHNGE